ncbi:hypothetical protein IWQ47_000502 [Aquimarina sp. EL_43]|uniref:DUF3570 domain-containing protein n=1 Tax=Aquimarina TaxID=290174 RepID=UPI0004BAC330|nr:MULTISPECIES: DUF3570 domain-containing protein [unclassified Aquimarina]MBG6128806.1 hypothetical protein [Aquimarina sp. EL_35]MBG6149869.1 hypothetical protein [Aquimarina sp. EL_32]MBG6167444.1 hypothetical protein [Aquimarina sp. EL_43]
MRKIPLILALLSIVIVTAQEQQQDDTTTYKKRVLESAEVDFLMSYYTQDGDNAAVTGGVGTEELTDLTPTIVVSIPLNDDDVLTIDAGISAYSSASSSNVNPFDGNGAANPFVASSGASKKDVLTTISGSYSHSSDDRNSVWSANVAVATEYDYFSIGFGGSYSRLFNEKNTELSVKANVFLDTWKAIYPSELRDQPTFTKFDDESRNSYSVGLGFSQILSKRLQGSLSLDFIKQEGLLSTPFQRVQFADVADVIIEEFTYGDDVERLPDSRFKIAAGGRLHYYINEIFTIRTFYRYYTDDWGINSHTASIEIPIKITDKFTLYPSYRFYTQTKADYFAPFNQHLSTQQFYTSDYDLSGFDANQYGFGISYTDIFTKFHIWKLGLKSIDLRFRQYERDSGLSSSLFSGGFSFIMD